MISRMVIGRNMLLSSNRIAYANYLHRAQPGIIHDVQIIHPTEKKLCLTNLKKKSLKELEKTSAKANLPARRRENLFAKRCITFERASTERNRRSRPSPSAFRRRVAQASSSRLPSVARPLPLCAARPGAICEKRGPLAESRRRGRVHAPYCVRSSAKDPLPPRTPRFRGRRAQPLATADERLAIRLPCGPFEPRVPPVCEPPPARPRVRVPGTPARRRQRFSVAQALLPVYIYEMICGNFSEKGG